MAGRSCPPPKGRKKRLSNHRPAPRVDPKPIPVKRHFKPPLGPKIGIRRPTYVTQQASSQPQPSVGWRVLREEGRNPAIEQIAMFGKTSMQIAFPTRSFQQGIKCLFFIWQ